MKRILIPLLLYAWSLAWIASRHVPGIPPGNDSAYYLVTAKGFSEGSPFRDASSPDPRGGSIQGPSFFPAVLSLYWKFLHPGFHLLQILVALVIALGPVLAFYWLRLHLPQALALLAALSFGAAYMFIVQGNSVMTESVYIPMFYAALLFSQRGAAAGGRPDLPGPSRTDSRLAALLWVIMARTRVIGWIFLAVYLSLEAKRRRWALIGASVAAAAAWVAAERMAAAGTRTSGYADGVFTRKFPILVDPLEGARTLAENLGTNLFRFATAIDAHILVPYLYNLVPMTRGKRMACLAVFLWTVWGCWLTWRGKPALRPWMLASALSVVPTFLIFESHDSFRYLLPLFPFLLLFYLAPFQWLARGTPSPWRARLPLFAGLAMAAGQAAHSSRHDFESEFIDWPRDFAALHLDLDRAAGKARPALLLSPDPYYSHLETGLPALQFIGKHPAEEMRAAAAGGEAWAICGPRNDYFCERMEKAGMVFGEAFATRGHWRARRVGTWPGPP